MAKNLTLEDKKRYFDKVARLPIYITSLEYWEQIELFEYSKEIKGKEKQRIYDLISNNPDYPGYPEGASEDQKFQFWAEKSNSGLFLKAKTVNEFACEHMVKNFLTPEQYAVLENHYGEMIPPELRIDKSTISKPVREKKEYKSIVRARAFCLTQLYLNGNIDEETWNSKTKFIKMVKKYFPDQSGQTMYKKMKTKKEDCFYDKKKNEITETSMERYPKDYSHGMKLHDKIKSTVN